MADEIVNAFVTAFDDFNVTDLPVSGVKDPKKEQARAAGQVVQDAVDKLRETQTAGVVGFEDVDEMTAAVQYGVGTIGRINGGGSYRKTGAVGETGWNPFTDPSEEDAASAAASEALAEKWATEAEDVVVAGGKFSAKHYAAKAETFADDAAVVVAQKQARRAPFEPGVYTRYDLPDAVENNLTLIYVKDALSDLGLALAKNGAWYTYPGNELIAAFYSPLREFDDGEVGALYDPDLGGLWSDTDGEVPAAFGDRVARITDLSGNGLDWIITTEAHRPFLRMNGAGHAYLEGTGPEWMSSAPAFDFELPCYMVMAIAKQSEAAGQLFGVVKGDLDYYRWIGRNSGNVTLQLRIDEFTQSTHNTAAGTVPVNQPRVISSLAKAGTVDTRVNNVERGNTSHVIPADTVNENMRIMVNGRVLSGVPSGNGMPFHFYGGMVIKKDPGNNRVKIENYYGVKIGVDIPVTEPLVNLWTGVPTVDGVHVSMRLTNDAPVRLLVSESEDMSDAVYTDLVDSSGRIAKIVPEGFASATPHFYQVEVGGQLQSISGKFQTFPPINTAASFTFTSGSCWSNSSNAIVADNISALAPLFHQELGDLHYADNSNGSEASRQAWFDIVFGSPRRQALYAEVATPYIWDDHDYLNNNSWGGQGSRGTAVTAFRNRVPVPFADTDPSGAVYYSYIVGRVRFIVTDLRSMRSDPVDDSSSKTMMGTAQKAWFKAELLAAKAANQAVVWFSSVLFGQNSSGKDRWDGYATEGRELADFFVANTLTTRMLIISGDLHYVVTKTGTTGRSTTGVGGIPEMSCSPFDRDGSSRYAKHVVTDSGGAALQIVSTVVEVNYATGEETNGTQITTTLTL